MYPTRNVEQASSEVREPLEHERLRPGVNIPLHVDARHTEEASKGAPKDEQARKPEEQQRADSHPATLPAGDAEGSSPPGATASQPGEKTGMPEGTKQPMDKPREAQHPADKAGDAEPLGEKPAASQPEEKAGPVGDKAATKPTEKAGGAEPLGEKATANQPEKAGAEGTAKQPAGGAEPLGEKHTPNQPEEKAGAEGSAPPGDKATAKHPEEKGAGLHDTAEGKKQPAVAPEAAAGTGEPPRLKQELEGLTFKEKVNRILWGPPKEDWFAKAKEEEAQMKKSKAAEEHGGEVHMSLPEKLKGKLHIHKHGAKV